MRSALIQSLAAIGAVFFVGWATGCTHGTTSLGAPARTPQPPLPDRTLLDGIAERAQAIRDTLQPTSCEGLAAQLNRAECVAVLPAPEIDGAPLEFTELFEDRAPCVFVLATIARCADPKCTAPGHALIHSLATAFAITEDGLCVTNRHVFANPESDQFMVAATARGVVYQIEEVVAASEHDDVAIFRIDTRGDRMSPIPLRPAARTGASVAVISHPRQHCFMMTTGTIARRSAMHGDLAGHDHSRRRWPPQDVPPDQPIEDDDGGRVTEAIEITAEFAVGSSGGPVLDDHGNAVAMACSTETLYAENAKHEDPQAVVRICTPAESILRLVRPPSPHE